MFNFLKSKKERLKDKYQQGLSFLTSVLDSDISTGERSRKTIEQYAQMQGYASWKELPSDKKRIHHLCLLKEMGAIFSILSFKKNYSILIGDTEVAACLQVEMDKQMLKMQNLIDDESIDELIQKQASTSIQVIMQMALEEMR